MERLKSELETANEVEKYFVEYLIKQYLNLNPFERKLADYEDAFDDLFPLAEVMGMKEEDIVKLINKALEENKPYESEKIDGVIY